MVGCVIVDIMHNYSRQPDIFENPVLSVQQIVRARLVDEPEDGVGTLCKLFSRGTSQ